MPQSVSPFPISPIVTPGTFFQLSVSETIIFQVQISAAINGAASESSTIKGSGLLSGSVVGRASESGTLKGSGILTGSVTGHASESGILKGSTSLISSIIGHTTDSGILKGSGRILSGISGHTLESANLKGTASISSSVLGHTTDVGTVHGSGILIVPVTGHASVSLTVPNSILSSVLGQSFFLATLKAAARAVASITVITKIIATLFTSGSVIQINCNITGRSKVYIYKYAREEKNTAIGFIEGDSIERAFTNPSKSDLVQVIVRGGKIIWNVDYNGQSNFNPVHPTVATILGQYFGSSVRNAFPSKDSLYLFCIEHKGKLVMYVDKDGNSVVL